MPRNMSFRATPKQILDQSKTVTRRMGWAALKVGQQVQPVRQAMGLKKGEKAVKLGPLVTIISVTRETLCSITRPEIAKEGFPGMAWFEFVQIFCRHNKCRPYHWITRIEFEYDH
jgi:hypothetical protein